MLPDEKVALKLAFKFFIPIAALFIISAIYATLYTAFGDILFQNPWTKAAVAIFYPLGMLFALNTPIEYLRKKHAREVDMMFYFICLAFLLSLLVTVAAVKFGAIDNSGNFSGDLGEWFKSGLSFFISIDDTLYLSIAIIGVTIAPQIISYILSGLFGCASSVIFFSEIIEISFWLAVKPLITVSGISIGLSLAAYILSIPGFSINSIYAMIAMSSAMLYCSFSIVCGYKFIKHFMQGEDSKIPQRWKNWIMAIHKRATQYNKAQPEGGLSKLISRLFFIRPVDYGNCRVCECLRNNPSLLHKIPTGDNTES